MKIVLKIEIIKNKFFQKYFLSDLKIPENIPQYLKKAITVFNELMTDLRSISIQYENKINGLYALFVALERVNMRYIEKMKSRNNNPQTAKQQLKARLQICKNMKQVLKNTKKYEDVLTDKQKNLLPNSCNIDPLKPHSENLTELTNPYFKKPPTKQAKIPDLLTKHRTTSEIPRISPDTTSSTEIILPETQTTGQPLNECSSTAISTKSKIFHPWCKLSRAVERVNNETTEKTCPGKQEATRKSTSLSKEFLISSSSVRKENSEDIQKPLLEISQTDSTNSTGKETNRKREENAISTKIEAFTEKNEEITHHNEAEECNDKKPILSSSHTTSNQSRTNTKITKRKINVNPAIFKKKVLSIVQEEKAYPWQKDAAINREYESPLSSRIEKIPEGANKLLPPAMKSILYQQIDYPEDINKNINDKIERQGTNYVCINCANNPSFSTNRRNTVIRHVKTELGYYRFRCSFCDEKSNDPRTLINHYASTHGVPSDWLESNKSSTNN